MGKKRNAGKVSVACLKERQHRWEENIKMYHWEKGLDWIHLAQDRDW
jgi:hypothetical protein